MFLFQRIEETTMRYTDARHAVGEFIIQEWKELHKYTIADIAERTFTSKATVTRFAKSLGYDGWREFMKDYVEEIRYENAHESDLDFNFPFQAYDTPQQIAEQIKRLQVESIEETADLLDYVMLNTAVDRLEKARQVVIFAASPNFYYAELFRRKLVAIGYIAVVAKSGESGISAAAMKQTDCAVIISYSGNNPSKFPTNAIPALKKNKIPMIGISGGGENYMRKMLDCNLTIATKERLYTKIANYSTEESIGYILNVLYSVLFARNYRENKNYKIYNSRMLEQERQTAVRSLQDADQE